MSDALLALCTTYEMALDEGARYPGLYRLLASPRPELRKLVGDRTPDMMPTGCPHDVIEQHVRSYAACAACLAPFWHMMRIKTGCHAQVEEEVRRAGQFRDAEDVESIQPVLIGWLCVLANLESASSELQQLPTGSERPRWRQPQQFVGNALCTLLPLLAAPALQHVVQQVPEMVATFVQAALIASSNQCAFSVSNHFNAVSASAVAVQSLLAAATTP